MRNPIHVLTIGSLLVATAGSAYAQWTSQTIPLRAGWNAVFIEVKRAGEELDRGYLISAKDLGAYDHLAEIAEAGIVCLKVEGRKKKPEYVATVTKGYREWLDRVKAGEFSPPSFEETQPLVQIFSRGVTNVEARLPIQLEGGEVALERSPGIRSVRQHAPQAEQLARRYGHTLYLAIAHRAWGVAHRLAGEYPEAEARLNQALDLFNSLNTRWQIGRTLFELGELDIVRSDKTKAREDFERALVEFEKMKAVPDAERARAALVELKSG